MLADHAVRERIRTDLDHTLFVEAGAGSGKTTVLVRRIVDLVESGISLRDIAAVTFSEKAAEELRDRTRAELAKAGQRVAAADVDGAAIGTLHSFARRILTEHPIEARLPPLIEVLDEVASRVAADRQWDESQTRLLRDPLIAPALRLGFAAGLTLDHLRTLAQHLDANWDLVEERLFSPERPTAPHIDATPLRARITALTGRRQECRDPGDKLLARLDKLAHWLADTDDVDQADLLPFLLELPSAGAVGKGANWGGRAVVAEIREEFRAVREAGAALRGQAVDRILRCLLPAIAADTLQAATRRAAAGRLRFHDLLVLARRLVRHHADVRAQLSRRYRRILLDESQDTDPIQIELAVRIAAGATSITQAEDWRAVPVPPGALFFVGDGKQSIYRFRRADIGTYLDARDTLGEPLRLTTNFRSTPPLLAWLNHVFARLITEKPSAQPAYFPLHPPPDAPALAGPHVVVLGAEQHTDATKADVLREREAHDVAGLVVRAVREGWPVRDDGGVRPVSLSDITILAPTRTSITGLEQALDRAGVTYRTEAATFVYSAPEVRQLLLCAAAVDDPTDHLAIVTTLRTPLFACSDVDLWRWKQAGGSWNPFAPRVHDGVVADGLAQLRRWARSRSRHTPAELLEDILEKRRVLEAATDSPRYREIWRRLRFVVDQARAWSEAEHGSLREYLRWADGQADDNARVTETVLDETDTRAVRITTIHAAKGLEFPVVILTGLSSHGSPRRPPVLWPDGGCELNLGANLQTLGYAAADDHEQAIEDCEDVRLLYVACTRAKDHLAVSLHRGSRECPATTLADGCVGASHETWTAPAFVEPLAPPGRQAAPPLLGWREWTDVRDAALAHARVREAESATDIAHGRAATPLPTFACQGLAKKPRDLELPAWAKGRYGTAIGRAVHAVLQTVDLTTGAGIDDLAAAQALAEGVVDAAPDIAAAVRAALTTTVIARAARSPHWRETYVGTIVDGTLVEGYVDLLYRDHDGLVLVDYKTDAAPDSDTLAAYETQLRVYAHAIHDAAAEPVVRSVLLFLGPTHAVEHVVSS
ncbi:UvrD-helicase domain-containing protein [Actinophytocola sp.]|uniref:UvrD-helicase domain-containing protein n=1 Tax=Actinophytocola sp. TaxID=1872138 RepID=UPI002ED0D9F8